MGYNYSFISYGRRACMSNYIPDVWYNVWLPIHALFSSLRPRPNRRHVADDTFKRIFVNENVKFLIEISLKFVPKGPINNIPALVQIMAWCRPGDKPLSEPMMISLPTHICVTRPQWVKPTCLLHADHPLVGGVCLGTSRHVEGVCRDGHLVLSRDASHQRFQVLKGPGLGSLLAGLRMLQNVSEHDDVIKWKHFPRNWPFVRGIHRSPHKGQWRGALMFSLICARINGWVNNGEAGDLRRHRAHYVVIVMVSEWMSEWVNEWVYIMYTPLLLTKWWNHSVYPFILGNYSEKLHYGAR